MVPQSQCELKGGECVVGAVGNILLMLMLVVSSGCDPALHIVGNRESQWHKSPLGHDSHAAAAATAL